MATILIIHILLAVLYTGIAIWRKKSLPHSISAIVYDFSRGWQWCWTVWLSLLAITIAPGLIEATPEPFKFLAFATCACLLFTAAVPLVRGTRNTAHAVLAYAAGILSQICVAIDSPFWLLAWAGFATFIIWAVCGKKDIPEWIQGKGTFIIETICWLTTIGSIIIH